MPIEPAGRASRSVAITADNSWTPELAVLPVERVSISVSGTFTALVSFQRKFDGQSTWQNVQNPDGTFGFGGPTELSYLTDETCKLRIGVDSGNYTGGTVNVRIGKG